MAKHKSTACICSIHVYVGSPRYASETWSPDSIQFVPFESELLQCECAAVVCSPPLLYLVAITP